MPGPVPKRSEQRRRRNLDSIPDRARAGAKVPPPPLREGLSPLAQSWYAALADSGQSQFYEASDWATAQLVAEAIHTYAEAPTAALLTTILTGSGLLLATEGDRRRLRLELVREDKPAAPSAPKPRRLKAVDAPAS